MCSSWEVEEEDRAVRKSRLDRLLDQVAEVEKNFQTFIMFYHFISN